MSQNNTNHNDDFDILPIRKTKSKPDIVSTNATEIIKEDTPKRVNNPINSIDDIEILDIPGNKDFSMNSKPLKRSQSSAKPITNKDIIENSSEKEIEELLQSIDEKKAQAKKIKQAQTVEKPVEKAVAISETTQTNTSPATQPVAQTKPPVVDTELKDLVEELTNQTAKTNNERVTSNDSDELTLTKLINIEETKNNVQPQSSTLQETDHLDILDIKTKKPESSPVEPIENAQPPIQQLDNDIPEEALEEYLQNELETELSPKEKKSFLNKLQDKIFVNDDENEDTVEISKQEVSNTNLPSIEDNNERLNPSPSNIPPTNNDDDEYDFEEDDEDDEKGNFFKSKKFLILIIALVVAILIVIGIALYLVFATPKSFEVTSFIGKEKVDAQKFCDDNGLDETKCIFELEYSETVEENHISAQSIDAGNKMKKSDSITFTISQGRDPDYEVTLTDFTSMNEDEIEAWFSDNGFTNVTYEYKIDETKEDESFASINTNKTTAKRSDALVVTIYLKEARTGLEFEVPDFSTYTKANITAWGSTNKVTITFSEEYSDTIESGKVISQSPKAGEKIKVGDKLTIILSKGKAIIMDNFIGKTKAEAQSFCTTNGLKCDFSTSTYSTTEKGAIAQQSVSSKTQVTSATTIKFTMSLGSTVTIGDYKDKTYSDFESQVTALNKLNANLTISKSTTTTNDKSKDNLVIENTNSVTMGNKVTIKYYVYEAPSISVPDCSGSESAYKKSLTDLGLKANKLGEKYSTTTSGNVYGCSYSKGTKVSEGTTVGYYVSKGAYSANASDFNNKTKADAQAIITNANNNGASWSIKFDEAYNDSVTSGYTYGCSISSTTVTCNLSKGSQPTVPNYVGKTWTAPTGQWNDGNIKLIATTVESTQPTKQILTQSVAAGTKYDGSITVNVTISGGMSEPSITDGSSWSSVCGGADSCKLKDVYTVTKTDQTSDSVAAGNIISHSCDTTNYTCSVVVSTGAQTYTLSVDNSYFNNQQGSSLTEAANNIKAAFPGFNISVEESDDSYDSASYVVLRVVVNGETYTSQFSTTITKSTPITFYVQKAK